MSDRRKQRTKRILQSTTRSLLRSARRASENSQRISRALGISYEVIRDGKIYRIEGDKTKEVGIISKVVSEKTGLKKGSKIHL
ncbi:MULTISPECIES: hypothetical protein [Chryseobacterium]|uniref:50S ribosomal protein L24 n=1 Tax=Chryseobacterium balustinum TaxID=246 RepID=A0AAX2IND5_9FLAO|nr:MULTISPECIES: hypothetical protein [Chryseobacterium]AZB30296.1 hypothetical protein EB354_14100 [Chryseobacterium balustinum]OBW43586.1 hypothetical protein AB670_00116 [Chryseobacterium sp. MOF25P]OBW46640.1 hypothetical protein AB671_01135 [Chryseobacterium sp. BGARF1]SQA90932.1 Uncharacterised protein [Chryseobacterium balustinum]